MTPGIPRITAAAAVTILISIIGSIALTAKSAAPPDIADSAAAFTGFFQEAAFFTTKSAINAKDNTKTIIIFIYPASNNIYSAGNKKMSRN